MFNFGQETSCTYPRAHPLPQPFPWYNAYLPSPFEDQNNLAPTNQHAIPIYMTTPPLFVKDSVVAETPCNPKIISSSTFLKSHSDYSKEILNTYGQQQVAPTGLHDHPQITRKKSSGGGGGGGGGESSNANNKKSKDRHSKIVTTARPRHRRMRLSIDVAREFFDLQDKLKFERASKTVEWLLRKAKADIEKLFEPENEGSCSTTTTEMKTPSNSNSCEGASGLDEIGNIIGGDQAGTSSKPVRKERKRHKRLPPKRPRINPLAKEQREKARERARERTKGWKSKSQATLDLTTVNDYHGSTIANPSKNHINQQSYQSMEEHGNDFNQNMIINDHNCFDQSLMLQVSGNHERSMFEKDPIANCWNFQGHIDPLPTTSTTNAPLFNPLVDQMEHCWNPTLVANSQHNFGGTTTGLGVLQEALVSDYPLSEKSWEAYSSQNLF